MRACTVLSDARHLLGAATLTHRPDGGAVRGALKSSRSLVLAAVALTVLLRSCSTSVGWNLEHCGSVMS